MKHIVNGIFTAAFLIPAILLIIGKYVYKQFIRVRNDLASVPNQLKLRWKLFRKK